jgi:hypothetical protein
VSAEAGRFPIPYAQLAAHTSIEQTIRRTEQVCHHLSVRPMVLAFLNRSTEVLRPGRVTSVPSAWPTSTIDPNPLGWASPVRVNPISLTLFARQLSVALSPLQPKFVQSRLVSVAFVASCLLQPSRVIHRCESR